jgi:hypothetical protein
MINYTQRLTLLMRDIVARVEPLSFIDPQSFLVFARFGRAGAEGAYATCHCLCLPEADPGYYYWCDPVSGVMTRRSEWFVPKTPRVTVGKRRLDYLISFALPRFCDQRLEHSRKRAFYPGDESWVAKLDTVVHELFHIDPNRTGIRRLARDDGRQSTRCHSPEFFTHVAELVQLYLASRPDPATYEFLRSDFATLRRTHGRIVGTAFRTYPSYPQVYLERLAVQPEGPNASIVTLPSHSQRPMYTDADLDLREFSERGSRRIVLPQQVAA